MFRNALSGHLTGNYKTFQSYHIKYRITYNKRFDPEPEIKSTHLIGTRAHSFGLESTHLKYNLDMNLSPEM